MGIKITDMNPVVTPAMTDEFETAQSGAAESRRITSQQVLNNLWASANLASTQSSLQITGTQNMLVTFAPTNTSGAAATQIEGSNGANYQVNQFLQSGTTRNSIAVIMPKRWNKGDITLLFDWFSTTATGSVVWTIDYAIVNSLGSIDPAFTGSVTTTSTNGSTNQKVRASRTITISGTINDNATLLLRVSRTGGSGSDNLAATAFFISNAMINYTSNRGNDT
jgi:hypothetical protein